MQGSAYDYFKQSVVDPSLLDECDLDENTKQVINNNNNDDIYFVCLFI